VPLVTISYKNKENLTITFRIIIIPTNVNYYNDGKHFTTIQLESKSWKYYSIRGMLKIYMETKSNE